MTVAVRERSGVSNVVFAIVVVVLIVIAGVGFGLYEASPRVVTSTTAVTSTSVVTSTPSATQTSAKASLPPIKLGFAVSLTGPNSIAGIPVVAATQLWADQVNSQGGLLGHPVELVYYDDQTDPSLDAQLYAKLFTVDNITLCMAPFSSGEVGAMVSLAKQYNYVCLGGTTVSSYLPPNNRWVFSYYAGFAQNYTIPLFDFMNSLNQSVRPQRVGIFYASDVVFGPSCEAGAKMLAAKYNYSLVFDQGYPSSTTTDFSSLVTRMQSSNVQAVVGCGYVQDSIAVTKAMAQYSYNPSLLYEAVGVTSASYPNATGGLQSGILTTTFWGPDLPSSQAFDQAWAQWAPQICTLKGACTGNLPSFYSGPIAYAGLQVLQQAVEAVHSFNQTAIGLYIKGHAFSTIVGAFDYRNNLNGFPNLTEYLAQWHGTQVVTITNFSQITYPFRFTKP